MKTNLYKIICPQCIICGKHFIVKIRKEDKQIISNCFHSYMNKYHFLGWGYEIVKFNKLKTKIRFKNRFWEILAYTKIQRKIIIFFWDLFKGWQKIEYWECPICCKGE